MSKKNKIVFKTTDQVFYDTTDVQGQMMRYRNNSLAYKIGMCAIAFSILGAFICLNSYRWDLTVIIKILGNIVILLFGFLSIEKVKSYSIQYSYVLLGIGGLCVIRIFWIPLRLINLYNLWLANPNDPEAIKYLGPVITGDPSVNAYLPQSGVFRGVASMILIALAAACFIISGVIGVMKAKRYHAYMATQDTTKGV